MVFRRALLAVALVLAQRSPHAQQPSAEPQRFEASATAVLVDVVVRDKAGKPVTDLTAADFQLFEDDVPQEIGTVTLVAPPGQTNKGADSLHVSPSVAPTAASRPASPPSFVALAFDRLSPEGRALASKAGQAYLESARDNDFAGVFVVSNALETIQTYTTDRAAVKKALDQAATRATANFSKGADRVATGRLGNRSAATSITAGAEQRGAAIGATPSNPGGTVATVPAPGPGAPPSAGGLSDAALIQVVDRMDRSYESMMRDEQGYATTNGLLALIDSLSLLPGRKTVIFFAEGLAIPAAVQARFESLVATANRANVSVYTIDSGGLRVHSGQAETAQNINALGNAALDRDPNQGGNLIAGLEFNEDNLRADPSVSLKLLADRTGGFLINNTNNMARGFQTIDADRRFYYLLTYAPKNTSFNGEWRRITVKVPRRDAQVRSRNGYLAVRASGSLPLLAHEAPALADLDRTPLPTELPCALAHSCFRMPRAQGGSPCSSRPMARPSPFSRTPQPARGAPISPCSRGSRMPRAR